ncbi:hypothetical protein [Marinactinospora rubrisoli]|uniref:Uncharacterized protein n=1 Tax=Marinactinospora rubrisoli TaxID=2715399 RepID=A0ABW2KFD6_9ACTN
MTDQEPIDPALPGLVGSIYWVDEIVHRVRSQGRSPDPDQVAADLDFVQRTRREISAEDPLPARAHGELARIAMAFDLLGKTTAAVDTLTEITLRGPESGPVSGPFAARLTAYLRLAELHRAAGDTGRAAAALLERDAVLAAVAGPPDAARADDLDVLEQRVRGAAALAGLGGRTAEARAILADVGERATSRPTVLGSSPDFSRPWRVRRDADRALAGIDAAEGRHAQAGWAYVDLARAEEAVFLAGDGYLGGAWRRAMGDRLRAMECFLAAREWRQAEREARTVLHSVAASERVDDIELKSRERRSFEELRRLTHTAQPKATQALAVALVRQGDHGAPVDPDVVELNVPATLSAGRSHLLGVWREALARQLNVLESTLATRTWSRDPQRAERQARTVLYNVARQERLHYQAASRHDRDPALTELDRLGAEAGRQARKVLVLALARQGEWRRVAEAAGDVAGLAASPGDLGGVGQNWRLRPAPDDEDVVHVLERLPRNRRTRPGDRPYLLPWETPEVARTPAAGLPGAVTTAAASRDRASTAPERARIRRARLAAGREGRGRTPGR